MKRLLCLLLAALLVSALSIPALAAETPVVSYNGSDALAYTDEVGNALSGDGDFGTAFSQMLPGVTYGQSIVLKNTSASDQVRFYMSLEVLQTLKAAQLDGAGYHVTLNAGEQTLYSSVNGKISGSLIGGSGSSGELSELNKVFYDTSGSGILVATLAPGQSQTLTLSIGAEATMSDAYQKAKGTLSFRFFAERTTPGGKTNTVYVPGQTIHQTVHTGDGTPIYLIAGVLVLAVLLLLFTRRKKKKED